MALPTSRDQTFTPLSPVPAAFLNHVQDAIIAVNSGSTADFAIGDDLTVVDDVSVGGDVTVVGNVVCADAQSNTIHTNSVSSTGPISGTDLRFANSRTRSVLATAGESAGPWDVYVFNSAGRKYNGTGVDGLFVPIPVESGEHIVSVSLDWENNDTTKDIFATLERVGPSGLPDTVNFITISLAHASGRAVTSCSSFNGSTNDVGSEAYYVRIVSQSGIASGSAIVWRVTVVVTRP